MTVRTALTFLLAITVSSQTVFSLLKEGDVRLQGVDNTALQGRVEIYHQGAWLSVCDASWDIRKGDVVCRQLGFSEGAMSTDMGALFGQGSSGSWLTGITCFGSENSLRECTGLTYGTGTCSHASDVGVRCAYPMYQGCYTASTTGPLSDSVTESETTDIGGCLRTCRMRRGAFAGMQQGRKCTCGNSLSTGAKQDNSACNTVCGGNEAEICGGTATASIYRTENMYSNGNGGYLTSPNFPISYTDGYAIDRKTIMIPSNSNNAVVFFSYFKLATGDSLTLQAEMSTTGNYPGDSSGNVPEYWVLQSAATSFNVTFTVASGSVGDNGFALEYEFGKLCYPNTLPAAVAQGMFSSSKQVYYYNEEVTVDCKSGYEKDRDGFVCQLNGTWSQAPICSVIPTTQAPPPPTVDPMLSPGETGTTDDDADSTAGPVNPQGPSTKPGPVPCAIPQVDDGTVDLEEGTMVSVGQSVTLTCDQTFQPDGNSTATCLASGDFDVNLACVPGGGLQAWLIAVIVVAAVLAIVVIVLISLLILVSSEPKRRERPGRRRTAGDNVFGSQRDSPVEDRLVAIAPSVQQNPSAASSIISGSDEGGTVNQGAQTDADPALGELGDPMVGESDVYHPTRDYPGAGRRAQSVNPRFPAPVSPPAYPAAQLPRPRSMGYRQSPADFSMLANEELLAVRALDNVVSDFERGDQGYFLGPSSPPLYAIDRGSRYGSRQIQFSQRSRVGNFYGLY